MVHGIPVEQHSSNFPKSLHQCDPNIGARVLGLYIAVLCERSCCMMRHVNSSFFFFHRIHSMIALNNTIMYQHISRYRYSMGTTLDISFRNPWKVILLSSIPLASISYISRIQDCDNFVYLPAVSTAMVMAFVRHQFWRKKKKKVVWRMADEKATQ